MHAKQTAPPAGRLVEHRSSSRSRRGGHRVPDLAIADAPSLGGGDVAQLYRQLNAGTRAGQLTTLSGVLQRRGQPGSATGAGVVQRVGGQTTGYDPAAITKESFRTDVKDLFAVARRVNRVRKAIVTQANLAKLSTIDEKQKGKQVKDTYGGALTEISLDIPWLTTVLGDAGKIDGSLQEGKTSSLLKDEEVNSIKETITRLKGRIQITGKNIVDLTWKKEDGGTQPMVPILEGEAAFAEKAAADPGKGIFRPTFKKLGKEGDQEYVKDDYGTHTRRYAYMEKSYHQVIAYQENRFLTGKTQELIGAATGANPMNVNPLDFANQHLTNDESNVVRGVGGPGAPVNDLKRALAYTHQWKGSGPGQRGLSLTSTPKEDAVFGNQGESFKSKDGGKFRLDLARVNPADNILINHYSAASPTRKNLQDNGSTSDRRLDGHYQYERSVIKNRELYLQNATPSIVTDVTLHQGGDLAANALAFGRAREQQKTLAAQKRQKEGDLRTAWQNLRGAQQSERNAWQQNGSAKRQQNFYRGKFGAQITLNDGTSVNAFKYWQQQATYWYNQAVAWQEQANLQQQAVDRLQFEIQNLDLQMNTPLVNPNAEQGRQSGNAYAQGYLDGLAAKARGGSNIEKVFSGAYGDRDKKKHTPYWQGFGAALRS